MTRTFRFLQALALVFSVSTLASAQTIGTFSWQTLPYCNVITVTVVQQGGQYQLVGRDNQCGGGPAPVTGTAVPSGGDVRFGVTVATVSGQPAHLSATISLATLSGTWSDDSGHSGTFAFGGAGAGSPRPAPVRVSAPVTTRLIYTSGVTSAGGTIASPVSFRTLGTFTSNGGRLRLTWLSHLLTIAGVGGGSCSFQLRIDGAPSGPVVVAGLVGDEAVLIGPASERSDAPASITTWFNAVPAGNHTVDLWLRSVDATCADNPGNSPRTVLVEEYGAP